MSMVSFSVNPDMKASVGVFRRIMSYFFKTTFGESAYMMTETLHNIQLIL